MSLLAATTCMCIGEIRALSQYDINIKGEYIIVEHSFDHGLLKCVKTGIVRAILIETPLTRAKKFFYNDENSFVFNCEKN